MLYHKKTLTAGFIFILTSMMCHEAVAQCFASAGNPMGGSANMGVMNKNALRVMAFYRYHFASDYFNSDVRYHGQERIFKSANYNYAGTLFGYGITDRISAELETGYYLNKSVNYRIESLSWQTGHGLSNALVSLKYAFFRDVDNRFEITGSGGVNIPYGYRLKSVDGVVLPYDVQPSTASYGLVFQTFVIKENSFKSVRYFWINRFDKNFVNPDGFIFGSIFSSAAFFSRHFVFGQGKAKDWTLILQLRFQNAEANKGYKEKASGGRSVFFAPQINWSINETWNISLMFEKPVYQYYNGKQLGVNYAVLLNVARDFDLSSKSISK